MRLPTIIGHRGAPRACPENTLASFERALADGADAIELDVHGTRDGVVVVRHDPALPTGEAIAELTWREVEERTQGERPVPRLEDVLALAAGRAMVHIEVKGAGIVDQVVRAIRAGSARCEVHAFDHRVAREVSRLAPAIATGILLDSYLVDTAHALRAAGARTLWEQWSFIDAALVAQVHEAGGRVIAWTVNDAVVARRLAGWGVDGLCTDVSRELRDDLLSSDTPV